MTRLFLALRPPPEVRDTLALLGRTGDKGVRWVPPGQWHVTLSFLGDTDRDEVVDAMGPIALRAATAELGPGVSRLGRAVVIEVAGLDDLAEAVRSATAPVLRTSSGRLAHERDAAGYRAHLTLARLAPGASCALVGTAVSMHWRVHEVELVSSITDPAGAIHETVARFPVEPG